MLQLRKRVCLLGVVAITAGALVAGCADESTGSDKSSGGSDKSSAKAQTSNKATDDYTPHVGPNKSVIVDTLTWRVLGAHSAQTLGGEFAGETADGIFLVADLSVRNGKDESVTINSDQMKVSVNGKTYETDNDGTVAATLDGAESFFLKDLGPDVSTRGVAVFDVPPSVLKGNPEICFGELGFGSSQGCIRLPAI